MGSTRVTDCDTGQAQSQSARLSGVSSWLVLHGMCSALLTFIHDTLLHPYQSLSLSLCAYMHTIMNGYIQLCKLAKPTNTISKMCKQLPVIVNVSKQHNDLTKGQQHLIQHCAAQMCTVYIPYQRPKHLIQHCAAQMYTIYIRSESSSLASIQTGSIMLAFSLGPCQFID